MEVTRNKFLFKPHAFFLVLVIAITFAYWFAYSQLQFLSPQAIISSYPVKYFAITIFRCSCTIVICFLFSCLVLSMISQRKINVLYIACTYAPLILVYKKYSLVSIIFFILILQISLLVSVLRSEDYRRLVRNHLVDVIALATLFLLHLFLTRAFSPVGWNTAWHMSAGAAEIPEVAPIFKAFVLAKQFVFSTMDYSQWAGIPNPPITLSSPFLSFLTLVLDLPSISVESFHMVLMLVNFTLVVVGSFGFYLFLKYAAKLHFIYALLGACLMFFGEAPFFSLMVINDGGVFLSSYVVFPYALLLIALAFEKRSYILAFWAGAAIDSQFFFIAPHPEGTIYSFLFFGVFTLGLFLFSSFAWKQKFKLALTSFAALFLLSAYAVLPVFVDQLFRNMHAFAHTGDVAASSFDVIKALFIMLIIAAPVSFGLLRAKRHVTPVYLSSLVMAVVLLAMMLLTNHLGFNQWLVSFLHIGLHVWFPWRIGMFFGLSVFIITMYCLDAMTMGCVTLIAKKFPAISKLKMLFTLLSIFFILGSAKFIPYEHLVNNDLVYNPEGCNYYVSLQSLISNYSLLAEDKANERLIKDRLLQFENEINRTSSPPKIISDYKNKYNALLKNLNLTSAASLSANDPIILIFAKNASTLVDNYYLDKRLFCISPFYDWTKPAGPNGRVLRHSLSGLFENIPNRFSIILSAVSEDWLAGPAPGFFFNNQTTTMDTRFMTGLPLVTALYVLPKYDFVNVGIYTSKAPWNYFNTNSFMDPQDRKILDVSGIDIFTVKKSDIKNIVIPGTTELPNNINKAFNLDDLHTFINNQSYGTAYLANHIYYENPEIVNQDEAAIKNYFAYHQDANKFLTITNTLYQQLMQLKEKHDIILESNEPVQSYNNQGSVLINGIVGERAFFTTDCLKESCIFVFNTAKSPGWHAYVNDKKSAIMRANFAFMAVAVPHGKANVWFVYEPLSHWLGDFISLFSLIGIAFISVGTAKKSRRPQNKK
jgi:hypothetical protein